MKTITLSVPLKAKKFIKAKAALEGITMREFVLKAVGWKHEEAPAYTTDDFNEETLEANKDMEENRDNKKVYSIDQLTEEMKTW